MAHCRDEFSNHLGNVGYNADEAARKVKAVNDAYAVGSPRSKWNPAKCVLDPRGGYKVVIETIG